MQRHSDKQFLDDNQTLLIGLGGHKCASSWLFDYFSKHPDCFTSATKEQDYFCDFNVRFDLWRIRKLLKNAIGEVEQFMDAHESQSFDAMSFDELTQFEKMQARVHDLAANASSLTVFGKYGSNFTRCDATTKVCVDISLHYSSYGLENLGAMKNAHSKTRFLLSMRDPVERSFSQFRYGHKLQKIELDADPEKRFLQLQKFADEKDMDIKTSYNDILSACDQDIAPEHIFTCFYENIFNDATMKKLCTFLEIEFVPAKYDHYIHKTDIEGSEIKMSKIEREFLVDRYTHVYKYIDERFGTDAPDEWNWPKDIKTRRMAN